MVCEGGTSHRNQSGTSRTMLDLHTPPTDSLTSTQWNQWELVLSPLVPATRTQTHSVIRPGGVPVDKDADPMQRTRAHTRHLRWESLTRHSLAVGRTRPPTQERKEPKVLVKQKQATAKQCKACGEWVIVGECDKKQVALNPWSVNEQSAVAAFNAGIKLWVVSSIRELYGPVRPRFDWRWPGQEWKLQHGCPIELVCPEEVTTGPPQPPCEPPGTIPPNNCTRTPEARARGAISCDGCEPAPFLTRSAHELIVQELGATVWRIEEAGEVIYRAH